MLVCKGSSIEKECGCSSLAMVAENKVDAILERKLPRIAAPLILDKDDSVSHSAIGALVNISLMSPDICEQLVSQVRYLLMTCCSNLVKFK